MPSRGLGLVNALMIVASFVKWRFRPYEVEDNFEQWVTNRFGKRLFEIFFKTYTEKVWGVPCTEIRAEWAAQRIQNLSLEKAILSAVSLNKRSTTIKTLLNEFRYPRLGPGQMWERCRDRILATGNRVLLGHKVSAIETRGGRAVGVRALTRDGECHFAADHVISSARVARARARTRSSRAGGGEIRRRWPQVSRLRHGVADPGPRQPVSRQLDLHPFSRRQGGTHPELQQLEQGDGACPG